MIMFVPTKLQSQTAIDSTSVKKTEIRTANQIFAEHAAFSKTIAEQKSFIYSLQSINAEEVIKNQRLIEAMHVKDSTIYAKDRIMQIRDTDCQSNIKNANSKTTRAYVVAGLCLIVTGFFAFH